MGRKKITNPGYCLHKASGRAYSRVDGQFVYWPGKYDSKESRAAYLVFCGQLLANGREAANATRPNGGQEDRTGVIVATVVKEFLQWADKYYRTPDGHKTSTDARHRQTATTLLALFASFPVSQFGPKQVRVFQQTLVSTGLARKTINYRLAALKQMFRWASSNGIVLPDDYNRIRDFPALPAGRLGLPEPVKVLPVTPAQFAATLPFLEPPYDAIAELQRLTGCRPSEILTIRPGDIDRTSTPWTWTVAKHKSQWRGKTKILFFGPRAREILMPLLQEKKDDTLVFCLTDIIAARKERRRAEAKKNGKRCQTRQDRPSRATKGRRPPGTEVKVWSYEAAVEKAAEYAGVQRWTPNQLRHLKATELRRDYGLEAAQIGLGHARADVTQLYAERNENQLRKIAEETG